MKQIGILEPYSSFKYCWDIFVFVFLMVDAFYTPLKTTFLLKTDTNYNFFDRLVVTILFWDILVNLHTSYYSKGEFIRNKPKIFKNYFKNNIIIDLLIFIPFFSIKSVASWLLFFRIIRFKQVLKKVNQNLQFTQNTQAIIDLIKLIILIVFLAHLCGCAFFELSILQIEYLSEQNTWMHAYELINKDWKTQYINSIYFAVVTMITVGYGDVSPQNNIEKVFTMFVMIISWIIFGFSLNSIGQILSEMMKEGKILKFKFCFFY